MKLEIGAHPESKLGEDWTVLDLIKYPHVTYVTRWGAKRLPIKTNTCSLVYSDAVLEHIPWWQTQVAVNEVYRILKGRGIFELWVPNIWPLIDRLREGTAPTFRREFNPNEDQMIDFNARLFYGSRVGQEGRAEHFHRCVFDTAYLRRILKRAGFRDIHQLQFCQNRRTSLLRQKRREWFMFGMRGMK